MKALFNLAKIGFRLNQKQVFKMCTHSYRFKMKYLQFRPCFHFSSSSITLNQYQDLFKQKQQHNVDSATLFNQFNEISQQIQTYDQAEYLCKQTFFTLESRMEMNKVLQVCKTAISVINRVSHQRSVSSILYFKAKQVHANHYLGRDDTAQHLASELYALYMFSKEQMSDQERIKIMVILSKTMLDIDMFDYAEKFLEGSQGMIDSSQPPLELTNHELFQFYNIQYTLNVKKSNYREALEYGLIAYNIINILKDPQIPIHLLLGLYHCSKKLKEEEVTKNIMEQMKLHKPIPNLNIDAFEISNLWPFKRIYVPKSIIDKEAKSILLTEEEEENHSKFYQEMQQKEQEFVDKGQLEEGIKYCEELSEQLNQTTDIFKILFVQDVKANFYFSLHNFDKAIDLSLQTHKKLLELREYGLYNDGVTQQNIAFLRLFYYGSKNYLKSIEWGEKIHTYYLKYNIFDLDSNKIAHGMQIQIASMNYLKKPKEALEYSNFAERYLKKFKNEPELFELNIIKASLHVSLNQQEEVFKYTQLGMKFYQKNKDKVQPQAESIYYEVLFCCVNWLIQKEDLPNLIIFGKEYLSIRSKYEDSEFAESTKKARMFILMNLINKYKKEEKYEELEATIEEILLIPNLQVEYKQFYNNMIFNFTSLKLRFSKTDEAEELLKKIQQIFDSESVVENTNIPNSEYKIELAKLQSIFYYQRKDYLKSIQYFEQQLTLSNKEKIKLSPKQKEISKFLLNDPAHSSKIQELISTFQLNIEK